VLHSLNFRSELVLADGSGGAGLSEDVVASLLLPVTIPVLVPSLNAAVAASILLYRGQPYRDQPPDVRG